MRAPPFITAPGKVDFDPPDSENAKLEAKAATIRQKGSLSPFGRDK